MKNHEQMALEWIGGMPPEISAGRADEILEITKRNLDMPEPLDDPAYYILAYMAARMKTQNPAESNTKFTIAKLYENYGKLLDKRWQESGFKFLLERLPLGVMAVRSADRGIKSADTIVYWLANDPLILAVRSKLLGDDLLQFLQGMQPGDTSTLAKYADGTIIQVRRLEDQVSTANPN